MSHAPISQLGSFQVRGSASAAAQRLDARVATASAGIEVSGLPRSPATVFGMRSTLRHALTVELRDLLDQVVIVQQDSDHPDQRSASAHRWMPGYRHPSL